MSEKQNPNVYQRLNNARQLFYSQPIKKTGKNAYAKYSYFELEDIVPRALECLNRHGLCAYIEFQGDLAKMHVVNVDKPEETIVFFCPVVAFELKGCNPLQSLGGQQTYIRKYLWFQLFEIVEHDIVDDPGTKGLISNHSTDIKTKRKGKHEKSSHAPNVTPVVPVYESVNPVLPTVTTDDVEGKKAALLNFTFELFENAGTTIDQSTAEAIIKEAKKKPGVENIGQLKDWLQDQGVDYYTTHRQEIDLAVAELEKQLLNAPAF